MSWDFLHRWYMPFVWLARSSLVTVPMAIYFQNGMETHTGAELGLPSGDSWVLRDHFLETIVPYLLNLGVAVWLLDADGSTRWAAFWCLLLAIGRIVAPVALVTLSGVELSTGQSYIDWNMLRPVIWYTDIQMFIVGLAAWGIFARFVGDGGSEHAGAHAAHAGAY
jgi:hypothetical protein